MCRSVPQIPVRSTRINTSLIPTSGSGTCVRLRPGPGTCLLNASTASVCHEAETRSRAVLQTTLSRTQVQGGQAVGDVLDDVVGLFLTLRRGEENGTLAVSI